MSGNENEEELLQPENPAALYEEARPEDFAGPPKSAWDRFRRLALRSRRLVYGVFAVAMVAAIVLWVRANRVPTAADLTPYIESYFERDDQLGAEAHYRVEQYGPARSRLEKLHEIMLIGSLGERGARAVLDDPERKAASLHGFLLQEYETDLLAYAALKEGLLKNREARVLIENAVRQAVADLYVRDHVDGPGLDLRIQVPEDRVDALYAAGREYYSGVGLDEEEARAAIRALLAQQLREERKAVIAAARRQLITDLEQQLYTVRPPAPESPQNQ